MRRATSRGGGGGGVSGQQGGGSGRQEDRRNTANDKGNQIVQQFFWKAVCVVVQTRMEMETLGCLVMKDGTKRLNRWVSFGAIFQIVYDIWNELLMMVFVGA